MILKTKELKKEASKKSYKKLLFGASSTMEYLEMEISLDIL